VPTITVHHLENSRSHRILWLLEELGVDYEMQTYARNPETLRAPPELRELHPLGKAPVVTIDEEVLAESGAVIETLLERFGDGALQPTEPASRRDYRYWMHYAEGSLMTPLLVRLIFAKVRSAPLPFFIKPIAKAIAGKVDKSYTNPEIDRHLGFVEGWLAEHEWFAGDAFSAADIQMSYPVQALVHRGGSSKPHAKADAWLEAIRVRPAYAAAQERGGSTAIVG
jgi:glutathione S-transferase